MKTEFGQKHRQTDRQGQIINNYTNNDDESVEGFITMMMNQLEVIMIMQCLKTMKVDKVVHCKKTERVKTP